MWPSEKVINHWTSTTETRFIAYMIAIPYTLGPNILFFKYLLNYKFQLPILKFNGKQQQVAIYLK